MKFQRHEKLNLWAMLFGALAISVALGFQIGQPGPLSVFLLIVFALISLGFLWMSLAVEHGWGRK